MPTERLIKRSLCVFYMSPERVTEEIANFVYNQVVTLEEICARVKDKFGVDLKPGTLSRYSNYTFEDVREKRKKYGKEYRQRPENKAKRQEYAQRPGVLERKRASDRKYRKKPEVKEKRRAYVREYNQRPEIRERQKEYNQLPEVKRKKREYSRKHYQKPEVKKKRREYSRRPEVIEKGKNYRNHNDGFIKIILNTLINEERFTISEEEVRTVLKLETGVTVRPETIKRKVESLEGMLNTSPLEYRDGTYILHPESDYFTF